MAIRFPPFGTNVKGVVLTVEALLPLLNDGGSIVLNASVAADRGRIGTSVYAASKAALRSFARTWANELSSRAIRVNTVNPSATDTPGLTGQADNDSVETVNDFKSLRSQGIPGWRNPRRSPMRWFSSPQTSVASPPALPCPLTAATTKSDAAVVVVEMQRTLTGIAGVL